MSDGWLLSTVEIPGENNSVDESSREAELPQNGKLEE